MAALDDEKLGLPAGYLFCHDRYISLIKVMNTNHGSHRLHQEVLNEFIEQSMMCSNVAEFEAALRQNTLLPQPINMSIYSAPICLNCGKKMMVQFDGESFRFEPSDCIEVPSRLVANITVTSGKLVFADYFPGLEREYSPEHRFSSTASFSNHFRDCAAELNMVDVYTGNNCPLVYQQGKKIIVDNRRQTKTGVPRNCRLYGQVVTDRWWVVVACADVLKSHGVPEDSVDVAVHVENGVYEVEWLKFRADDSRDSRVQPHLIITKVK